MTQQSDNRETPPAVEPTHYEGPSKSEQRVWNWGTTGLIVVVAVVFLAVILWYIFIR